MRNYILKLFRALPFFRGKFRIGKNIFKSFLGKSLPLTFVAHQGIKYTIPNTIENLGNELLINGVYEYHTVEFLKRQIKEGAIYFDIGANIGSLGLPILKANNDVKYYGFEASPFVYPYLKNNFKENIKIEYQLYNNVVHKDHGQTLKFYSEKKYGDSSLASNTSNDYQLIKSISIDQFCIDNNIKYIDWIKIDVQGFEYFVLEGMSKYLAEKKIGNILFEFEAWAEKKAGLDIGIAKAFIQSLGYDLYNMRGKKWKDDIKGIDTMIWAKPSKEKLY